MKGTISSVFAAVLALCATTIAAQKNLFIFKTSASISIQFTVESTQFSTQNVYHVEEATTSYFRDLITRDESLRFLDDPKNVLHVAVTMEKQTVEENHVILDGTIDVFHYGDQGIIDLAALLTFLVNKNNTDASYVYLDDLVGMGATVDLIDFTFVSESIPVASNLTVISKSTGTSQYDSNHTSSEKTLIVLVTLLAVTVVGMAAVLCWVGGGWLELRKQVKILIQREEELTRMTLQHEGIHPKPTEETEADKENSPEQESKTNFTNPSGVLGVYGQQGYGANKFDGLGINIKTPSRSKNGEPGDDYDDDLATPMSTYSDTDRAPIGIMSMRKLIGPSSILHHRQEDENDIDEEEADVENYGMKKLEY